MKRTVLTVLAGILLVAIGLASGVARVWRTRLPDLARARADHERLRKEFERLAGRDPVVSEALAQGGDVILGVSPALVQEVGREVAARYLDRVDLDLPLEAHVHDSGELKIGTFLGRLNAGTWTLDVTIHRVHGVLRAHNPRVAPGPDNTLRVELPVMLEEAHGSATVHLAWESHSVAKVVCRDFEITRRLEGRVLADEYTVTGGFQLSAGPESLRAEPVFPSHAFRVRVDMSKDSWAQVRAAIDEQDEVLRCGLALDPDALMLKLRERLHEGFDLKLPRSLFRPIDFPASVRESATIEDRQVDLAVRTRELKVTPQAVWYGADVRTRIGASASPSPTATPAAVPSR
jgi:hypothetical protein